MIISELIFTENVQGVILHSLHFAASMIELLGVRHDGEAAGVARSRL